MTLDIIIPAYNEEAHIGKVLEKLDQVSFPEFIKKVSVTVVDDRSSDRTADVANNFSPRNYSITVISKEKNEGKGKAVKTGIAATGNDFILVQDADTELDPDDIPKLLLALHDLKIEFINGSRYLPGPVRPLHSYKRYYFNKLFTRMASVLINVRLTDLACGYKLFSRNIYNQLKLRENGFGFEAEILIKVARLKKTLIAEVPVRYFPRNAGDGKKIRNMDGVKIFWVIVKYGMLRIN